MTQLQEKECLKGRFVHLHLHTLYSALDGAIKIKKLAEKLKANGMEACAITDHGVMYGIIDFYNNMKTLEQILQQLKKLYFLKPHISLKLLHKYLYSNRQLTTLK